jgi:phosphatidylserine/phosphatidylglycerophosphate/cardiolipin synthase-like enzyme
MKVYVLTAKSHPWLLPPVEDALKNLDANAVNDVSKVARSIRVPGGRPISDDEALVAFNALCDLGVLERNGSRYNLNKTRFDATEQLRSAIHAALAILGEGSTDSTPEVQLCVSLPPSLSPVAEHVIHESSTDLRSSLLDVVASAKQSLIVASPFWDAGTTSEMVSLVRKKLASGVQVWLLGRFSRDLPADVKFELGKIASDPACAILSWFEGTGTDTQTFHFKAISADGGHRAYVGSANMTVSSLRSRMELGVILSGSVASHLDRILRVVMAMAAPVSV